MAQTEEQKQAAKERRAQAEAQAEAIRARRETLKARHKVWALRRWLDQQDAQDRLRSLVPQALDVLTTALGNTADPKLAVATALGVLRATGCYGMDALTPPGSYRDNSQYEARADAALVLEAVTGDAPALEDPDAQE